MKKIKIILVLLCVVTTIPTNGIAQVLKDQTRTKLQGRVYDILSQNPISNVSVELYEVQSGKRVFQTQTDAQGNFMVEMSHSKRYKLITNSLGYIRQTINLSKQTLKPFVIYLEPQTIDLKAVTIQNKADDKAFFIMKNVIKNKSKNYKLSAAQYNYLIYNKVELFASDFNKSLVNNLKIVKDVKAIVEKNTQLNKSNSYLIPLLVSETLNKKYENRTKNLSRTDLVSYNMSGIGIQDEKTVSEFMNPDNLINIDLSQNTVQLFKKYFVSPLNDTWRIIYNVDINRDNIIINGEKCVELYVYPKHKESAAFRGTIVIRYKDYALISAQLSMPKETVINFVKNFTIKQDFADTGYGLMPRQTYTQIELTSEITDSIVGGKLIVKNTTRNQNFMSGGVELPDSFYTGAHISKATKVAETGYWKQYNHGNVDDDTIDDTYKTIDQIKKLNSVKLASNFVSIISQGYLSGRPLALSDVLTFIAYNNIEGFRPQIGARTTRFFNKNIILSASVGYGFRDKGIKWQTANRYIINRSPYTAIALNSIKDIVSTGLVGDNLYSLHTSSPLVSRMYKILSKWGDLYSKNPINVTGADLSVEREINNSLSAELILKHTNMAYVGKTGVNIYYKNPFNTSEAILRLSYNPAKHLRTEENREISFKRYDNPQIFLWVILGSQNMFTNPNSYQKVNLNIFQRSFKALIFGTGEYDINLGYINGNLPYPLLRTHIGNSSFFLFKRALLTVNEAQVVSDKYISLSYHHKFDAPLYDYVPVIHQIRKYLNLDLVGSANIVWGSLGKANREILSTMGATPPYYFGNNIQALSVKKPFVELGIGLTNILNIFRIDFVNRVTYRDIPNSHLWRILVSSELSF